jgi:hypothetical protein
LATAIHSFHDDADSMLEKMGLDRETLAEVNRRGLAQYLTATLNHPVNAAGSFLYFELVRSLRELFASGGWERAEEGLSLTFNEECGIAIAVASGNMHAGNPTTNPSFKYPKGTVTQAAVGGNARQLGLFDGVPALAAFTAPAAAPNRIDFNKFQTWWLLHHVDTGRSVMRAELSLPVNIGTGDETDQWETRIILDPIPFDEEPDVEPAGGDDTRDSGFDVPVRKKA